MARALAEGARSAGTLVLVSPVHRVRPRDLLDFDAVALGARLVARGLVMLNDPEEPTLSSCRSAGRRLAA